MPQKVVGLVVGPLKDGKTQYAHRVLSTLLSTRYKPERPLFEEVWTRMLKCDTPLEATQCYEMLKLLQSAFPPGPDCEGWCPGTGKEKEKDYELLMECLEAKNVAVSSLAPDEEKLSSLSRKRKSDTWSVVWERFH